MRTALTICAALFLASCGSPEFEDGGSSYALVSRDANDPCRVFVSDMGRSSKPIKPFVAKIEGCK